MKIGSLVSKLFDKAGIDKTNAALADVLAIQTEVPDYIAGTIDTNLLTLDAAKNNAVLKSHYFAQALNGTDAEINRIVDELGLEEGDKAELAAERNTMRRVALLTTKIKELEAKKAHAAVGDKKALEQEIATLNTRLTEANKQLEEKVNDLQHEYKGKMTALQIKSFLRSKEFANELLPPDLNIETANILLNNELARLDAAIVPDENGNLHLRRASDTTLDWMDESNQQKSVPDFIDSVLATNKLLKVTNAAGNSAGASAKQAPGKMIPGNAPKNNTQRQTIQRANKPAWVKHFYKSQQYYSPYYCAYLLFKQ